MKFSTRVLFYAMVLVALAATVVIQQRQLQEQRKDFRWQLIHKEQQYRAEETKALWFKERVLQMQRQVDEMNGDRRIGTPTPADYRGRLE